MKTKINSRLISEIGVKEKYIRKEHYNSIKVWWARRPITAMRNLLINEIIHLNSQEYVDSNLVTELNPNKNKLKDFATNFNTGNINVLDVFSGGGSIPFESSRLGCNTFSSELNPLAVLAQKTVFNSLNILDFHTILKKEGSKVIDILEKKYQSLYKIENDTPYVYFWSKTMKCRNCNSTFDLGRIKYLSKRASSYTFLLNGEIEHDKTKDSCKSSKFKCHNCGKEHNFNEIKQFCKNNKLGDNLICICKYDSNKKYELSNIDFINTDAIHSELNLLKKQAYHYNIDWSVKTRGGVINPTLYDLSEASDFFNERQQLVLFGLINTISSQYIKWKKEYGEKVSIQLVYSLSSLIEFLVDWNSKGTMWISQNEQTGRSLAGPGVGMKWDYIEINPFFNKGSNLRSKLLRVCDSFKAITHQSNVNILEGSSTSLNIPNKFIDIILTDPPYFDSIEYTGLSEFFRPWHELLIKSTINPNIVLKNNESKEAIVELHKNKNLVKDSNHYLNLMTDVLRESARVLKDNGVFLLLYSHKTIEGWNIIAKSIKAAGLFIKNSIPYEMERIARPRAMQYDALNGVIVFSITKNREKIISIDEDICLIEDKLSKKEILDSHIVIYLASLACKELCLNGGVFIDIYKNILNKYQTIKLSKMNENSIDTLSKIYLRNRLSCLSINNTDYIVLKEHGLINDNKNIVSILEINESKIESNSMLYNAKVLFLEFEKNSKTKITKEKISNELLFFISCISGLNLNTVKKRSSNSEVKIARLIVSKFTK